MPGPAVENIVDHGKLMSMRKLERFTFCIMLLPAVSCAVDDAAQHLDVEQHTAALVMESNPPCATPWGEIKVTVRADSIRTFDPCKLFDGNTDTFAIIAGEGPGRTRVDIELLQNGVPAARTLTGFHTEVGGLSGMPASNRFDIIASCAESSVTFPDYRGYANRTVALAFRSPCTAGLFTIRFWRDHYDGLEHIAELTPIFYGAQTGAPGAPETPLAGDHYNLLSNAGVDLCDSAQVPRTASILSHATGAQVGTIELHRSPCTRHPSGTPVDVYFARARSAAGLPGEIGSVFLESKSPTDSIFRIHKSTFTTPTTGRTSMRGNVFADEQIPSVASLRACARFYPAVTSSTSAATSSGCTGWFSLP